MAANAVQQGVSGGGQLFKQKIIGNLSFVQHKRAVQKMLDIIEIMRRKKDCLIPVEHAAHQLEKILAGEGVLAKKGFVHQYILRPLGEPGRKLNPGFLASRKAGNAVGGVQRKKVQEGRVPCRVKRRVQVTEKRTVFPHRQPGVVAAFAGDIADPLILRGGGPAVKQRLAFRWQQASHRAQQRRFAGAVVAQNPDDLAVLHRKARAMQPDGFAVPPPGFTQIFNCNHGVSSLGVWVESGSDAARSGMTTCAFGSSSMAGV